jgi:hypothetical protein
MRIAAILGASALALAFALPAAAEGTAGASASDSTAAGAAADPAGASSTGSASASSPAVNDAGTTLTSGQAVKDNTGATIGKITKVQSDASGKQFATIQMGADVFAVDASALAVDAAGSAVINETQDSLKAKLKARAQ